MAKVGSLDIVIWVRNMKLDLGLACNCCGSNCILGTIVPCHQVKEVVSLRVTFEDKPRIHKNAQRNIDRFHAQFPRQHDTRYSIPMLGSGPVNINPYIIVSSTTLSQLPTENSPCT